MIELKKVFLDTEFTGLHKDTTLISIGLIADTGETFYAELNDYDKNQIDEWVRKHVIKNLLYAPPLKGMAEYWCWDKNNNVRVRGNKQDVGIYLTEWFQAILGGPLSWIDYTGDSRPSIVQKLSIEIWSDCLSYDWVLFNNLFEFRCVTAPKCVYYIPFDICTYFKLMRIDPDISREKYVGLPSSASKHNALWDARVIKACFEKLSIL
jgi:hypothetical protein